MDNYLLGKGGIQGTPSRVSQIKVKDNSIWQEISTVTQSVDLHDIHMRHDAAEDEMQWTHQL